ncbi:hypothetical protein K8W59_04370 [Nocardioides rotundus]|uniref:hypothetical protein n=1 Tax=Nocardioides rotundus TaxID=1774216 RepID=UPI001CBCD2B8|nr:hypothetical protein [Nocardioides rotundus]UAL30749.1 hypothetical protein K8W59_04370 [Nocardioides rotundus]
MRIYIPATLPLLAEWRAAGRVVVAEADDPDADVEFRRVAAVHADVEDRPAGADPDEDLGWYAVQELDDLLR